MATFCILIINKIFQTDSRQSQTALQAFFVPFYQKQKQKQKKIATNSEKLK